MQLNATSLGNLTRVLALSACVAMSAVAHAQNKDMRAIPGGVFQSVLPPADGVKSVNVASFKLDATPVTNAQFAKFVVAHPEWRRDRVARVFADQGYLRHWVAAVQPAASSAQQPVVHVSWFAASAYCESRGARLPTWYEWEYAAAASQSQRDARDDPAWRQQILDWYSKSGRGPLPDVAKQPANVYGVHDLHGAVWEWIDDLSAMMVSGDNRQQSDPDVMRFCGTGALSMEQKENYAILMRIAMLSSMQANYTSATTGFRCATGAMP
jgi:sulfatase modifying factor 1